MPFEFIFEISSNFEIGINAKFSQKNFQQACLKFANGTKSGAASNRDVVLVLIDLQICTRYCYYSMPHSYQRIVSDNFLGKAKNFRTDSTFYAEFQKKKRKKKTDEIGVVYVVKNQAKFAA